MKPATINPNTLQEDLQQNERARVIDVRTPGEYASEHLRNSQLIPLHELDAADLQDCINAPVYLLCRTGKRASQAGEKLASAGFSDVRVIEGGLEGCKQAGLATERGRGVISLERQVRIGAGALVLLGVLLGWLVHPGFFAIAGFVGAGLLVAGITDWCGMAMLLARMPWNQRGSDGHRVSCSTSQG